MAQYKRGFDIKIFEKKNNIIDLKLLLKLIIEIAYYFDVIKLSDHSLTWLLRTILNETV